MRIRPQPHGDSGFTLVELIMSIAITAIIAAATTSVVISMLRTQVQANEISDVLAEARAGLLRAQNELREVKRLYPGEAVSTGCEPGRLAFWVDEDLDGLLIPSEQVTYELVPNPETAGTATLVRWTEAAPTSTRILARNVSDVTVFSCDPPPDTRVIDIRIEVLGERDRHDTILQGSVRLRNVDYPFAG